MYNNINLDKKKKKIIELSILIVLVLWTTFFIIDYLRYKDSKHPLIVLRHKTTKFEDGEVVEYKSIGWVYREYKRRAISDTELTPFWKSMQRPPVKGDLPDAKEGYDVPDNPDRLDEYKGIVYFYDYGSNIVGTYKCINTATSCSKAVSGYDEFNISSYNNPLEELPKFDLYDFKYAWIDDSTKEQTADKTNIKQYQRTIYLFDVKNNKILAEYRDIKYSTINDKGKSDGYLGTYIVKNKENKWGVIRITSSGVQTAVDFDYDSVNFNEPTATYIVKKDNLWYLLDQDTKELSSPFEDVIAEAVFANGTTLIKTVKQNYIGADIVNNYYLSKLDGTKILSEDNIVTMKIEKKYILYLNYDKQLKIIDFDGNQKIKEDVRASFIPSNNGTDEKLPFYTNIFINDDIKIYLPLTNSKSSTCKTYYYAVSNWELKTIKESESCI